MIWPFVARHHLPDRSLAPQGGSCHSLRSSLSRWSAGLCLIYPIALSAQGTKAGVPPAQVTPSALRADLSLGPIRRDLPGSTTPAGEARSSSLAHYAAALQLEAAGKLREALGHYISAVRADPSNAKLASYTAELALNFNGRPAAIHLLEDCVKANPNSAEATLSLANFLITYPGDDPFEKDRAVEVLADAVKRFPTEPEIYRLAVVMHLTRSQRPEAIKLMQQAARQTVAQPEYWLALGRLAQEVWPLSQPEQKQQHRDQVNAFFVTAMKHAPLPEREDIHLEVAQYYLVSNQIAASTTIVESLAKTSKKLDASKLLVALYQAAGKETEAIQLLETLAKAETDSIETHRALTTLYEDKKRYAESIPHREAIIRISGGTLNDFLQLGALLLDAQMPEKALDFLTKRALPQFPDNPQFCYFATIANRVLRRYDEALRFYDRTVKVSQAVAPQLLSSSFYQGWGDTLQAVKRYDEASIKYQKSISLTQQDDPAQAAVVLNNLGYMWLEQGKNLDQAGDFIRKAIKFAPDSLAYQDSLGWYHFLKGEHPEALKVLLEVEAKLGEVSAEDAEILDHIAQTYEKLGNAAKALEYYKRAALLAPLDEKIHERYKKASSAQPEIKPKAAP